MELVTTGGTTEVDKNVLDRLVEPLVHIIRNAADHGIEEPDRRKELGKPAQGAIRLSAWQEGGEVLIAIEDDGRGLDPERIRARGIERNLLDPSSEPSEDEIFQLIFSPGFSTADSISNVSGRGVGMDAVRVAIDTLGGQLTIDSQLGKGARITLRLPLTLAIVDGMVVRLGDATFIIPLAAVEECVEFEQDAHQRESGRTMLAIRDEYVPFVMLEEAFCAPPSTNKRRRVVIVKADGQRLGLVIDDILGQNQTVIKKLSPYHRDVEGFVGATILGDGTVALIVDVSSLARRVARVRAEQDSLIPEDHPLVREGGR
jgi:two-component system chemotaxis sensor kinase CheA